MAQLAERGGAGGGEVMMRSLDQLVEAARRLRPARIAVAVGHDPEVLEGSVGRN